MQEIFDPITSRYKFHTPCTALAPFIEYFWESTFDDHNNAIRADLFTIKLFPSFTPTFLINLGDSYRVVSGEHNYMPGPADDLLVCRNKIVEYRHTRDNKLFGVKFFAGALQSLLNTSLAGTIGKALSLDQLISSSVIKKIKKASCFEERVGIMQQYLLNRCTNAAGDDRQFMFVQKVISEYHSGDMELTNAEIAARLFTTPKTLCRTFTKLLGVPPKSYFFILRARKALTGYVNDTAGFSPLDYGYYDMSHFYKDVIKFTGKKLSSHRNFCERW